MTKHFYLFLIKENIEENKKKLKKNVQYVCDRSPAWGEREKERERSEKKQRIIN